MRGLRIWLMLCPFMVWASPAAAQVGGGALTGLVVDPSGAAAPGASVTVTDTNRGLSRTTVSSSAGLYFVAALGSGSYRVRVDLTGFKPIVRDGVRIETGETARLDLMLALGDEREAVVVIADAPILRIGSAGLGSIVTEERIAALPLNGRAFITLASLVPGIALPHGSFLPRINGGRPRTNEYLFDGISALQPEPGQVVFFPIIDAIQEFKIESNSPPAEFGRFNGGVINLTTKSGGNVLHGTTFGFVRNEALNARNLFQSTNPVKPDFRRTQAGFTVGGPLRRDRTFFFADYQGQRQSISRTVISTVPTLLQRKGIFSEAIGPRVPSIYDPATLAPNGSGGFTRTPFADNMIPPERMDPVALALLERYPRPTSSGTANNYRRTANEVDDQDQFDVRIDHRIGEGRDVMFARLSRFQGQFIPVTRLPEGSGVTTGTLGPQDTKAWSFASSYQRVFSDRWLNELRIGDTRRSVSRSAAELSGPVSSVLGLPGIPSTAQFPNALPTIEIGGYTQLGSPPNTATLFSTSVTEVADSLLWVRGRHAVKTGFDWRWERLNVLQPPSPTGRVMFNSLFTDLPNVSNTGAPLASFLLGQVNSFSIDLQKQQIRNRAHFQEYFVQDDWKVSDRWTIAPGLRYTLNFPSTEEHDQAAVFNLETEQLEYLGRDGNPRSARRLHKLDFGPRIGVAGRLNERTVISAGAAVVFIEQAGVTTPFTTPVFPFLQTVSQRTLDNRTPAFVLSEGPNVAPVPQTSDAGRGQGVFAVDRDLGSGYVRQWNAAVQRQLTANTVAEIAYVGSRITRVGIPDSNLNQLTPEQLAVGSLLQERVQNPFFGIIPRSSPLGDPEITRAQLLKPYPMYQVVSLYRNNIGTTSYNGVTVRLEQRWSRGLSYSVAYTRSKLADDASSVFDASILTGPVANFQIADSFDLERERDISNGDIPHVFVSSATWDLPWGYGPWRAFKGLVGALANDWNLAAIVTLQSGIPIAVTQTTNFNAFAGFGTQRPNLVGDPELPEDQRSVQRWFNTGAFAAAPVFTLGNASRNPVRGPSYRNVDLVLSRRVPLLSRAALELRAEVFNLLNTPPLGAPNGVVGTPGFGTITTAGDPRVIQLAVKVSW
jgi:hypothetical protein